MFTKEDFEVNLVNKEEVKKFVENHGEFACICYNTDTKYARKVGQEVLKSGHLSGSRADFFKFEIRYVPRYTVDQAVRHDIGVVKNVESQRYVDMAEFNIFATDLVNADLYLRSEMAEHEKMTQDRYKRMKNYLEKKYLLTGEKANDQIRAILPIGCESSFNFALNLEGLTHFANVRLCNRADAPIRKLAQLMVKEVLAVAPIYKDILVPKCEKDLYCSESNCCGRALKREDLIDIISQY